LNLTNKLNYRQRFSFVEKLLLRLKIGIIITKRASLGDVNKNNNLSACLFTDISNSNSNFNDFWLNCAKNEWLA
jgi:hypothetical protein